MKRLNSDLVTSFFWIAVGSVFLLGGIGNSVGTFRKPGPGFLPVFMAGIVTCLGLALFIQGLINESQPLPIVAWKKHLVVIISIIGYTFLIGLIGFPFSTFVLMIILFGILFEGERKWVKAALAAAVTAFAAWLVFSVACQVPFPRPLIFRG